MITLATLADATEQQVFDQVAAHLLTQNKKSQNKIYQCQYRNPNGLKCAAGCLISDEEMVKVNATDSNGSGWATTVKRIKATTTNGALICRLQDAHDCNDPHDWKDALKQVAKDRGLQFNWVKPAKPVPA